MTNSSSRSTQTPLTGARTAAWLGGCLLLGLLVQMILARNDRDRVTQLETFSETTAVGDRIYYSLPTPLPNPPVVVARVRNEALVPVSYEKVGPHDTEMRAYARDSETKLTIYELRVPPTDASTEKFYFVKTASNEYLKLRTTK